MIKNFEMVLPERLIFGCGQVMRVGELTHEYGRRALLVSYPVGSEPSGALDRVASYLRQAGVEVVVFDRVQANPLTTTVDEGAVLARRERCDVIVGVGGGSAMDTAKAIALAATNEGGIWNYMPPGTLIASGALPIVLVTTTAGTGSHATRYFVLSNPETQQKNGCGYPCAYARASIVDPELTLTLPRGQTSSTGLDVLFHALEAFVYKGANRFTDMLAEEAMRLVVANLKTVYRDGGDIEARTKMSWADTAAGIAIDQAGTVLLHAMAHPPGGRVNATHGLAIAACALPWMRFSYSAAPERFARIAEFLGEDVHGLPVATAAARSVDGLERQLRSVDARTTLSDLGVREDMLEDFTRDDFKFMAGSIENSPRPATFEQVVALYREAL